MDECVVVDGQLRVGKGHEAIGIEVAVHPAGVGHANVGHGRRCFQEGDLPVEVEVAVERPEDGADEVVEVGLVGGLPVAVEVELRGRFPVPNGCGEQVDVVCVVQAVEVEVPEGSEDQSPS